jgi:hypothetical protein
VDRLDNELSGLLSNGIYDRIHSAINELDLNGTYLNKDDLVTDLIALIGNEGSSTETTLRQSILALTQSELNLNLISLGQYDGILRGMNSQFKFGTDIIDGPYFDMILSETGGDPDTILKMRLTTTKLMFMQGTKTLAYFSDAVLNVPKLFSNNQISIGRADYGGFLDIITTETGVGFKWRV